MIDAPLVTVKVKVQRLKRVATVKVTCHYWRVHEGVLACRLNRGGNAYPETVAVFAAGYWLEVHRDDKA